MKNAKIKNRQKLGMLVVTMVLVLLMTLIAGMLTGCGKNTEMYRRSMPFMGILSGVESIPPFLR